MLRRDGLIGLMILALLFSPLALADTLPGGKVTFPYRPVLGVEHVLDLNLETAVAQTVAGHPVVRRQTAEFRLHLKVSSIDKNGAALTANIVTVKITTQTPFETVTFDSATPPAQLDPELKSLAGLTGRTFRILVTPKGMATDIKPLPADKAADPFGIRRAMRWDDSLAACLTDLLAIAPPGAVGLQDGWKRNITLPSEDCPLNTPVDLHWVGAKDGAIFLNLAAPVSLAVKNTLSLQTTGKIPVKADLTTNLSGTVRGEAIYGARDGFIQSAGLYWSLNGTAQRPDGSVPVAVEARLTVTSDASLQQH